MDEIFTYFGEWASSTGMGNVRPAGLMQSIKHLILAHVDQMWLLRQKASGLVGSILQNEKIRIKTIHFITQGQDSCKGDSGGPLITRQGRSNPMYLRGVVSFGTIKCGNGYPGVYINVAHYANWIQANMRPWSKPHLFKKKIQIKFLIKILNCSISVMHIFLYVTYLLGYIDCCINSYDFHANLYNKR